MVLRGSDLVTSGSGLCSLQVKLPCWLCGRVTVSSRWIGSQPSVKRQSAPSNLRPWFSAGKRWSAFSGSGRKSCPKWRSSGNSGCCSQVRGKMTGGSRPEVNSQIGRLQRCRLWPEPLQSRKSWADLCSYPHLWSPALGSDRKMRIAGTSGWNEFPPQGGWALPLR